jgi:soluble lytic murein transglycosylase
MTFQRLRINNILKHYQVLVLIVFCLTGFAGSPVVLAKKTELTLTLLSVEQDTQVINTASNKKTISDFEFKLLNLKKAIVENRSLDCLAIVTELQKANNAITGWLNLAELKCAYELFQQRPKEYKRLFKITDNLEERIFTAEPSAHLPALKSQFFKIQIELFKYEINNQLEVAKKRWALFNKIYPELSDSSKKEVIQWIRKLADKTKNTEWANIASPLYSTIWPAVDNSLPDAIDTMNSKPQLLPSLPTEGVNAEKYAEELKRKTQKELKLRADFMRLSHLKKTIEQMKMGIEYLTQFPETEYSEKISNEMISSYLARLNKSDESESQLSLQIMEQLVQAPIRFLAQWARVLLARESFYDVVLILKPEIEKGDLNTLSTDVLSLFSDAAFFAGMNDETRWIYQPIETAAKDSPLHARALFRLGHTFLREGQFKLAEKCLEDLLNHKWASTYELSGMYWLWRAQKQLQTDNAENTLAQLLKKYPISYFALKARAETNNDSIDFPQEPKIAPQLKLAKNKDWSPFWDRYKILIRTGFMAEAWEEINFMKEPEEGSEKIIWAKLWSLTNDYVKSTELVHKALALDAQFLAKSILAVTYPKPFLEIISRESQKRQIPEEIIISLIKQESGFKIDALSPAGALGLMQLLPSTAQELARDLKIKSKEIRSSLIIPEFNVKVGTYYYNRRLRYFNGHVPLSLASYNAGIGNIRNWMSKRADYRELSLSQTSDPFSELWFEELPWPETTHYIKSILRNLIVYKIIATEPSKWTNPVWLLPSKG